MPFERKYRKTALVSVALAQFAVARRFEYQRQVSELRSLPSESFVKQHMKRHGRKPFLAAYHMGYLHRMVIDYIGQMIRRHTVRFVQYFVVQLRHMELYVPAYHIVYFNIPFRRYFKPYDVMLSGRKQFFHLVRGKGQRIPEASACGGIICKYFLSGFRFFSE